MRTTSRSPTPTSGGSSPPRSPDESVPGPSSSAATSPESSRVHTHKLDGSETEAISQSEAAAAEGNKKRTRTLTTPYQSAVLHDLLAQSKFPTTQVREDVGRTIGLSARKVQIWFQNQRQKAKRAAQAQLAAPTPPQYGPYTHTQAASSSLSTMTAIAPALDPGMGGAVAGLMFSSGGFFGGSRSARKPPPLPPLPEHASVASSSSSSPPLAPGSAGASGLPTKPGPYRSGRPVSRSASRMSMASSTSSWSRHGSEWTESTSSFSDLPPPRFVDDSDRRSVGSGHGSGRSVGRGPATGASSPAARTSIDLGALSLGPVDPPPHAGESGIELPPIDPLRAGRSSISLPPPFTLEPKPVWDAPGPPNPYAPRTSTSSRFSASSGSLGRAMDPREPLPELRTVAFARVPQRWDPVRAAASAADRHRDHAMDVDSPSSLRSQEQRTSPSPADASRPGRRS